MKTSDETVPELKVLKTKTSADTSSKYAPCNILTIVVLRVFFSERIPSNTLV